MLNEEKIRLMAQLSMYDKREGRAIREAGKYFRGTYISRRIFMSMVHYTLCFVLLTLLLMLMSLEQLLLHLNIPFILAACRVLFALYVVGMLLMAAYTYARFAKQYDDIHRKSLFYEAKLEKLLAIAEGREMPAAPDEAEPQSRRLSETSENRRGKTASETKKQPKQKKSVPPADVNDGWLDEPVDVNDGWLDEADADWPETLSGSRSERKAPEPDWLDEEPDWLDDPEEDEAPQSGSQGLQLMNIKRGTKA